MNVGTGVESSVGTAGTAGTAGTTGTTGDLPETLLAFSFTGSGREYFRVWAVNVVLTVLTLGDPARPDRYTLLARIVGLVTDIVGDCPCRFRQLIAEPQ